MTDEEAGFLSLFDAFAAPDDFLESGGGRGVGQERVLGGREVGTRKDPNERQKPSIKVGKHETITRKRSSAELRNLGSV